jgi:hypothetical protein
MGKLTHYRSDGEDRRHAPGSAPREPGQRNRRAGEHPGHAVLRTEDRRFLTTDRVYAEDVLAVFTGRDLAALRRESTRAC